MAWEAGLPVGHGGIEYLVGQILDHLLHQLLLHVVEVARGGVGGGGRKLALEVLGMVHVVGEPHVDRDGEFGLGSVVLARHRLVALLILRDLALDLEVAVATDLLQLRVVGKLVLERIVEHGAIGPHIGGTDGEIGYLDGLGLGVVDAGAVEGVLRNAGCRQGQQHPYHHGRHAEVGGEAWGPLILIASHALFFFKSVLLDIFICLRVRTLGRFYLSSSPYSLDVLFVFKSVRIDVFICLRVRTP